MKIKKKKKFRGWGGGRLGGQGGCERKIEVFVKIHNFFGRGGGGGGQGRCEHKRIEALNFFWGEGGGEGGGQSQGRCERRSEVFVKIKKKNFFGGVRWGGGVQGGCERNVRGQ